MAFFLDRHMEQIGRKWLPELFIYTYIFYALLCFFYLYFKTSDRRIHY